MNHYPTLRKDIFCTHQRLSINVEQIIMKFSIFIAIFLMMIELLTSKEMCYTIKHLDTELYPGSWIDGMQEQWYNETVYRDTYRKLNDSFDPIRYKVSKWKEISNNSDKKLMFTPDHCILKPLNSLDTFQLLMDRKIKLFLIGDSLTRHFARWLRSLFIENPSDLCFSLYDQNRSADSYFDFKCKLQNNTQAELIYYNSYNLESEETYDNLFRQNNATRNDIAIFNFGAHYKRNESNLLLKSIHDVFHVFPIQWPRLIWRETIENHYNFGVFNFTFSKTCYPVKSKTKLKDLENINKLWSNIISPSLILKINMPSLDRYDEHIPLNGYGQKNTVDYDKADCLHYCSPSSVYRLLGQITFDMIDVIVKNNIFTRPRN